MLYQVVCLATHDLLLAFSLGLLFLFAFIIDLLLSFALDFFFFLADFVLLGFIVLFP